MMALGIVSVSHSDELIFFLALIATTYLLGFCLAVVLRDEKKDLE